MFSTGVAASIKILSSHSGLLFHFAATAHQAELLDHYLIIAYLVRNDQVMIM